MLGNRGNDMKRSNSVFDHVMVTMPMLSTLRSQYEMLFLFFGKASLVQEICSLSMLHPVVMSIMKCLLNMSPPPHPPTALNATVPPAPFWTPKPAQLPFPKFRPAQLRPFTARKQTDMDEHQHLHARFLASSTISEN
jgi:hypothetical protein